MSRFVFRFLIPLVGSLAVCPAVWGVTNYTPYAFTTLAGSPAVPAGNADGMGAAARFNSPKAVAVDGAGNVYVADSGNNTIRKMTPGGGVTTLAGTPGVTGSADGVGAAAQFSNPSGVAVDGTGNVFVVDSGNSTIRKITPGGSVTTLAGMAGVGFTDIVNNLDGVGAAARFWRPLGIAIDQSGNLYVADSGYGTIRKITPAGSVTTIAGKAGTGYGDGVGAAAGFNQPAGIAVDGSGNVYVTDEGANNIRKVAPDGTVTTLAGLQTTPGSADGTGPAAHFLNPTGVAVDGAGNLFVTDENNDTIREITPGGVVTTLAGQAGNLGANDGQGSSASFRLPWGVVVDASGNLYVADSGNNAIRKITSGGAVTTLAGLGGGSGTADGVGAAAAFEAPAGLALDGAGNLYVTDSRAQTLRKIAPDGTVTTLAGHPNQVGAMDGPGATALFTGPAGVAVDSGGNIYVADSGNNTIRKVTSTGVVTTLAGRAGATGSADGPGTTARFNSPYGLAIDSSGVLYVADGANESVRKVAPDGSVTTLAHVYYNTPANLSEWLDPFAGAIAIDSSGNVYVGDYGYTTISKVGMALPFAGSIRVNYVRACSDGTGINASFAGPAGLAVDSAGNVFVADAGSDTIRRITPAGIVTTLGGVPFQGGSSDGPGFAALFDAPGAVAVDATGKFYVADTANHTIRVGTTFSAPIFTLNPVSTTVASGHSVAFSATAIGQSPPTYQWSFNGVPIVGATDPILLVGGVTSANAGSYTCTASDASFTTTSAAATLAVAASSNPGFLSNLSARAYIGTGPYVLIGGYALRGAGTKQLLIRGAGPALTAFLGGNALATPQLTLLDPTGAVIASNLAWGSAPTPGPAAAAAAPLQAASSNLMASVGAYPYQAGSNDTAILATAPIGNSTAEVNPTKDNIGIGLVEFYDADTAPSTSRLVNLSARSYVAPGNNVLIGGFAVAGGTADTLLIRAVGPGLNDIFPAFFPLSTVLQQPVLTIYQGGTVIASNALWGGDPVLASVFTTVGAFSLNPAHQDCAVLVTLPPGNYTAQVSGANSGIGIALVEIYEVP